MDDPQKLDEQARECLQRDDYEGARCYFERALVLARASKNVSRLYMAQLLNNIGFVYRGLRKLDLAQSCFEQALKIYRESGSVDSPDLAITLQHMGRLAQMRGDNKTAWAYWTEELAVWKRLKSPEYIPELASCLHACGEIMADAGEYAGARRNFEQALELRELTLPSDHADIAESLADLGRLCAAHGDDEAARTYLKRALPLFISELGTGHPIVQELQATLARVEKSTKGGWLQSLFGKD